jgi:signal transduction histidine kinase
LYAEGVRSYTVVPLISQGELIGSLNLSYKTAEQHVFTQEHEAIARQVADQLAVAIQQARLREQIQRHAEELEQRVAERTAELEQQYHRQAVLEERQRLARDLHDSVTQTLFSMTLTAEATRILLERDPTRVPAQLDRLHELTQEALAEMRALVRQLRSTTADQGGLVSALQEHIAERQAQDGLRVTLNVAGERQLLPEYEEALFRIVQEGLNNVVKHAQTEQAEVTLRLTDETVILLIEDDGVGFDPSTMLGTGPSTAPGAGPLTGGAHFGLASMRERAKMLDGSFMIEARPGTGTRIKVEIPIFPEV